MAQISIPITYPDNAQSRIVAALRAHYGPVDDGQGGECKTLDSMTASISMSVLAAYEAGMRAA